jgi:hypothetical protein
MESNSPLDQKIGLNTISDLGDVAKRVIQVPILGSPTRAEGAFGLGTILQYSSTPSLRSTGFEDEDDDENENEATTLSSSTLPPSSNNKR